MSFVERPLMVLVLALGLPVFPVSAAEQDLDRIADACQTVRGQQAQTCDCLADMARTELDDRQQALLAAWLENNLEEAAALMRDGVSFEAASEVAEFESSKLIFCSQYS